MKEEEEGSIHNTIMASSKLRMEECGADSCSCSCSWSWGLIRNMFNYLIALLLIPAAFLLAVAVVYLAKRDTWMPLPPQPPSNETNAGAGGVAPPGMSRRALDECDLFSGRWLYDNVSYPLYKWKQCKFLADEFACDKYGRRDRSYQHWRWQPNDCDLPTFDAKALLERLRNKRMVFVGDSLNRGQWVSMVCLMESIIPSDALKSMNYYRNVSLAVFKAKEYNASVESYWAPMLVESNSDDPIHHRVPDPIVRVQEIEKHARHWSDADIIVFNSYIWWRRPRMEVLWGSFESPDGIYKDVEMPRAYEMALNTWSQWLEVHVNLSKTELFFVSMSPSHEKSEDWGSAAGQNCYQETEPIAKDDYWGSGSEPAMMRVVETAIDDLRSRGVVVQLLNITQLSEYRKEAHTSIYRKQYRPLDKEQVSNPSSYADCFHWCLPGVPDVWNELLFTKLFKNWAPRQIIEQR